MNLRSILKDKDEKNLINNIVMAFIVKGLALFISVFSMPQYIKYFDNDEVLGLWYTILSLLSWVLICDLGLGNGLRNRLTEALAVGDIEKAKNYVSSTYAALIVVVSLITIIGGFVISVVDLNSFFNISTQVVSPKTLTIAVLILFVGVCLSFVLKTINSVIYAIQKSSLNNIIALITSVIPLAYIVLFKGDNIEQNLINLTIVHIISLNLPLLLASLVLFSTKTLRKCMPSYKNVDFVTAKGMLGFGMQFFLAQIFFMFLTTTNEIFITKMYSASKVVDYSIYFKLFTVIGSLFMLALTPLWSKVTKDFAQKKYDKIIKTNRVLYGLSSLAAVAQFIMVVFLQFVINIWLQDEAITVHYPTAIIFAFYGGVYIFNIVLTTVANGLGELKTQIWFYGLGSLLKIPTIFFLSSKIDNWSIIVLYNGIVLLVFCVFQFVWIERRIKKLAINNQEQNQ